MLPVASPRNVVNPAALCPRPTTRKRISITKPACCRSHHRPTDGSPVALRSSPELCRRAFSVNMCHPRGVRQGCIAPFFLAGNCGKHRAAGKARFVCHLWKYAADGGVLAFVKWPGGEMRYNALRQGRLFGKPLCALTEFQKYGILILQVHKKEPSMCGAHGRAF